MNNEQTERSEDFRGPAMTLMADVVQAVAKMVRVGEHSVHQEFDVQQAARNAAALVVVDCNQAQHQPPPKGRHIDTAVGVANEAT